jgi:ribosomal protein L28
MKKCELCGKQTVIGIDSTHKYGGKWARRGPRRTRIWRANLRTAKIKLPDGTVKKMTVCMKCYKKATIVK